MTITDRTTSGRKAERPVRIPTGLIAMVLTVTLSTGAFLAAPEIGSALAYEDALIEDARGESPTYLSLLDGPAEQGYRACAEIMESGLTTSIGGGAGWTDTDLVREDLDVTRMLWYPTYDTPMLSAYNSGSTLDHCITIHNPTGAICIETPATEQEDDLSAIYEKADRAIRAVAQDAMDGSGGSVRAYIRALTSHYAESVSYSKDDTESAHANDIYGAAVLGRSCCFGYATTMKYALDMAGLPNIIATGKLGDEAHAWNMVRVCDKWLCIDVTRTSCMLEASGEEQLDGLWGAWRYCLADIDAMSAQGGLRYSMSDETRELLGW